jgi:hypothetical protein
MLSKEYATLSSKTYTEVDPLLSGEEGDNI